VNVITLIILFVLMVAITAIILSILVVLSISENDGTVLNFAQFNVACWVSCTANAFRVAPPLPRAV
jgi:hypothetical protein